MVKLSPRLALVMVVVLFWSLVSMSFGTASAEAASSSQGAKLTALDKVYFPDYNHFVADPFLRFWRANGRLDQLGGPVSKPFANQQGQTVQFFEKIALAYSPDTNQVRPYEIGSIFYNAQPNYVKNAAPFAKVPPIQADGQKYFPESGHKVSFGFLDLYNNTGGVFIWGVPLSEEYPITFIDGSSYTAQIFERGRMLWSAATGAIIDPNFGKLMASFNHADMSPEFNADNSVPNYDPNLWEHWVDVNLSTQSETFYEGDVPVRTNLVTTGLPGDDTPTGTFYILRRVYNEHMDSGTVGNPGAYDLYNVLFTQYFTNEGHALHYAWWRSVFGVTGSHGCVNEDYTSAEFAWNWLSLGSRVQIHY